MMRAGITVKVTRTIAVRLRRLCPIATRRRSMSGAPKSSLQRPTAAARPRSCADPARPKTVVWRWQAWPKASTAHARQDAQTRQAAAAGGHGAVSVDLALSAPPGEASHWTGRILAKAAGVSLRSVQRILEAQQLAPLASERSSCRTIPSSQRTQGHCRPLRRPARSCGGPLGRRKEPNPGARPHPAGLADETRPRRHDDA